MVSRIPAPFKRLSQSEEDALYDHVGKASMQHLRDRTAGILTETSDGGIDCGTAVAVEIEGQIFLLTAAHNFKGAETNSTHFTFFSANRSSNEPLKVIGSNYNAPGSDGSNDVAWVEVEVESAKHSALVGTDMSSIDPSKLKPEVMVFLMGFPAAFTKTSRDDKGALNIIAPMMMYFTHVISDDGARLLWAMPALVTVQNKVSSKCPSRQG